MSKSKRILSILTVACLLCVAYLWFFGVATMLALEARYVAWKMPIVKTIPTELPDQSIAQASGQKLNYFGYEFEVPWEIDEAKSKQVGQMRLVAFRSGNSLLVSRMAPKEFVKDFLSTGKADPAGLRNLYGEEVLQSDYLLKQRIFEVTPEKVGLLTPRKEAVGGAMLLLIKGIMMPSGAESGIYQIRAGDFRGFQFGDPRSRPKSIDLEIYNQDGGLGFIFTQRQNTSDPAITQAQINRIVQALRKLPNQD
ncbi:MAG TPA: hypothetical protein VGR55_06810 [Candidatus Acidoferrum sp.]|nr:hypothetical protein [Candidatus Acidoferrum sp.]